MPDRRDDEAKPEPIPIYRMGKHGHLLSALMANARASLGEIAERLQSYRQKVWRTVQSLEGETIWGYTAVVDEHRLGWRRYIVLLKVAHASTNFNQHLEDLETRLSKSSTVRLVNAHIITGVDYNFLFEVSCQTPIDLQVFQDMVQSSLGTILERPPKTIEAVHSMRLSGFRNPDDAALESLVEDMGIVRRRLGVNHER